MLNNHKKIFLKVYSIKPPSISTTASTRNRHCLHALSWFILVITMTMVAFKESLMLWGAFIEFSEQRYTPSSPMDFSLER